MASTKKTVTQLFAEIDETPFGPHERSLIQEAIRISEEAGDDKLAYKARLRLTASAHMGGDTDTMLSSFGWCVAKHDSDPRSFPATDGHLDLLWQFKWMAGTLSASPLFPREDIAAALDDMEAHYNRAGVGMSGVLQARFTEAVDNGRLDDAATARAALRAAPRDDYSHCDACVRAEDATYLDTIGDRAASIAEFEEIFDQNLSCGDEPENSYARVLLPYLREGELEKARHAHLRGYRMARGNESNLGMVANHLVFCAITGNEARGLTLLERHIDALAQDGLNAHAHFTALTAFALVLESVVRAGHPEVVVRGADSDRLVKFFGAHDGAWTAGDLATACWSAADALAAAFDERNGNDFFARRVSEARALVDEHYDVPIEGEGFVAATPIVDEADPTDAAGWLVRAGEANASENEEAAVEAARAGLTLEPDTATDLGLRSELIGALVQLSRLDEAREALNERLDLQRRATHPDRAAASELIGLHYAEELSPELVTRITEALETLSDPVAIAGLEFTLGQDLYRQQRSDEALPHFERAAAGYAAAGEDRELDVSVVLAYVLLSLDRLAESIAAADRALAGGVHRGLQARALFARAQARYRLDDNEGAASDADDVIALWLALRSNTGVINVATFSSAVLKDLGRFDEAIARFRLAIRYAELVDGFDTLGLRFGLGRLLVNAGRAEEGAETLLDVYAAENEADAPPGARAETLYWLGYARRGIGEHGDAYGAWSRAVELYDESGDVSGGVRARIALANLLAEFDDGDAVEILEQAAQQARTLTDEPRTLLDALHTQGRVQARFEKPEGLTALDEALAIARGYEAAWLIADISDSKARALASLGRADESVPAALEAADLYEATGDVTSAGYSLLFAANLLVSSGDAAGAVAVFTSAIERLEGDPGARSSAGLSLGDALESLGRLDEAGAARAAAE